MTVPPPPTGGRRGEGATPPPPPTTTPAVPPRHSLQSADPTNPTTSAAIHQMAAVGATLIVLMATVVATAMRVSGSTPLGLEGVCVSGPRLKGEEL
jgi:hypothetical protein